MKLDPRKLNIALIVIYLACMVFTAYSLFQLQDDLVYSSKSLSISAMSAAKPVLIKLNLIISFTLLFGLATIVFLFKNRNEDIIYVEKKKTNEAGNNDDSDEDEDADTRFSTSFLNEILKSEKDEQKILDKALAGICKKLDAGMGALYTYKKATSSKLFQMKSTYALSLGESQTIEYELGEGLIGQAGKERKSLIIDDIPDGYIKIVSGLGSASPTHLLIQPIEQGKNLYGVIEIASFTDIDKSHEQFVHKCMTKVMEKLSGSAEPKTKKVTANKKETKSKSKTTKSIKGK